MPLLHSTTASNACQIRNQTRDENWNLPIELANLNWVVFHEINTNLNVKGVVLLTFDVYLKIPEMFAQLMQFYQ